MSATGKKGALYRVVCGDDRIRTAVHCTGDVASLVLFPWPDIDKQQPISLSRLTDPPLAAMPRGVST